MSNRSKQCSILQVSSIIGSLSDIRPANWVLSEQYQANVQKPDSEEPQWQPDISYYIFHIRKIADSKFFATKLPSVWTRGLKTVSHSF